MKIVKPNQIVPTRAIRIAEVCNITGASRATVWRWAKTDPTFPKPFHVSVAVTCWDEAEIVHWLETKKAVRGVP